MMHKMASMAISDTEAKAQTLGAEGKSPKYPYGLKLHLDAESLKKLGIEALPAIGEPMILTAKAVVCDIHMDESNASMGLQITDLEMYSASPEIDFSRLYSKKAG